MKYDFIKFVHKKFIEFFSPLNTYENWQPDLIDVILINIFYDLVVHVHPYSTISSILTAYPYLSVEFFGNLLSKKL